MWKWVKRVVLVVMLLLSGAIGVLWVHSYFAFDLLYWEPRKVSASTSEIRCILIISSYGGVKCTHTSISRTRYVNADGSPRIGTGFVYDLSKGTPPRYPYAKPLRTEKELLHLQGAGFEVLRSDGVGPRREKNVDVVVPFWFLLLLTSLYPAIVGVRYVRRRRREGRGFPVKTGEAGPLNDE